MIHFEPDTYRAVHAGESIQLLPKEFVLLRFLYEHAGRSFSREQLLDSVWRLETPGDRTVDDHIYRIRKKLSKWSHLLSVETIRGQGYKLTRIAPKQEASPLLQDEEFAANVNRMMSKYHGLGMGQAMQLLSANRDILRLPGDPFYDVYIHFVRGDFDWLITTDSISLWQKAAYAVFIHANIQFDYKASLYYFERLIAKSDMLTQDWQYDLQINVIFLYIESGMLKKAREQLEAMRHAITDLNSPSFTAIYLLKEMHLELQEGHMDAAELKLQECEALLIRHPMQRERGAFLVSKAFYLYQQGAIRSARKVLDEGIETIRQTHFIPHLLGSLKTTLMYFGTNVRDETYRLKYQLQWNLMAAEYHFKDLLVKTEHVLGRHL
ncbi:winged helix-turn-helix domain-containing protein [Cohnella luojiensis]|nr:winged helix-turn-helix domain-containing protein [Cohnella luojiensis]